MKSVDLLGKLPGNSASSLRQILEKAPYRERLEIGRLPGLPQVRFCAGQVIEVLGEHPQSWIAGLIRQNPKNRIGWISSGKLDLCPMALAQESIPLSRFLFLEEVEEKDGFSKIAAFLKSGLFQLVVFEQAFFKSKSDVSLRKLQLFAEEYGVGLVMRSKRASGAFSVHIVVDTSCRQSSADFIKVKGGTDGR
jgi:hypothetical protein